MIKRLAKCIGEYKRDTILTPIFVTFEVIMEVIMPYLMALIIDRGISKGDLAYISKMGAILVLCALFSLFFGMEAGKYAAKASSGYGKNMRKEMYHNLQNFSFSNIDKFSTSSLITRLTTDVTNVQNAYQMIIRILARGPLMLIFSLIVAFGINARLALVFLVAIPFLGGGLYFIIMNVHPIFEKVFRTYDKLNNVVQENISGIRVVKSYVREEHEKNKFEEISTKIYRDFSKAEKILAFNSPLMQFTMYVCILLISWFGAKMIVSTTMTEGQLVSLLAYATQILMSLMMLSMVFVMIVISRASAERIVEVLDEKSDLHNPEQPIYEVPNGGVSFENVDFSYTEDKSKLCLKKISFSIKEGETIGIIGGTGSSKTTFAQLIPRLYDVVSGSVLVGGIDVRKYDIQTLRDEVAMVLQKNVLFSGTINENLRWGNKEASDEELIRMCKLAQADEFIETFPHKYDTYIEQGGSNLSGGQKQRLCIARALLKRPKILILDDSTSAVDTKTDSLIRRAFKEEIPNTTKFIIAQRISSVQDADKIIIMEGGRLDAMGTHEELLKTNKIYQEVYNSQMKGAETNDAE